MSVKNDVLEYFENHKNEYISGEDLANQLSVSRSAVWKAVKTLQNEGFEIEAVTNRGYCLRNRHDMLSVQGIKKHLDETLADLLDLQVVNVVDSTNTQLKAQAAEGAKEWTVMVAEQQTAGKGRMNRVFYSPSETGIYMSILFRPTFSAEESLFITTMAAVAVTDAISKVMGRNASIKWVNDIYLHERKVCGILTEASLNIENGHLDYAVLGIGMNVKTPKEDFPEELRQIAGALELSETDEMDDLRCKLAAETLNRIYHYYKNLESHEFMKQYVERSFLIGKRVYIVGKETETLLVKGISEKAGLLVEHEDGSVEELSSGEVSVRQTKEQ